MLLPVKVSTLMMYTTKAPILAVLPLTTVVSTISTLFAQHALFRSSLSSSSLSRKVITPLRSESLETVDTVRSCFGRPLLVQYGGVVTGFSNESCGAFRGSGLGRFALETDQPALESRLLDCSIAEAMRPGGSRPSCVESG